MEPSDVRTAQEARQIVEERGLSHVKVGLFDLDGVLRGKYISREKFFSVLESGFGFCDVVFGWDINDQLYDGVNVQFTGWHTGFPDAPVRVLPETCRNIPFEGLEPTAPITGPVFIPTVQILLTNIPSIEYGPTQYVPGSHCSGRHPNDPYNPSFEGRGPVSIFCKAGDIYLHNSQCWHRGAPNTSARTRYLLQQAYGMRWVSQRFYPFVNYQLPPGVLERADERRKRVLGFHSKGAYG